MIDDDQKLRLLNILLDGLDDLYDQRFGWPPHRPGGPTTEIWLSRLFVAAALAFDGSHWEQPLSDAASTLAELLGDGVAGAELNDRALELTGDLRSAIAAEA